MQIDISFLPALGAAFLLTFARVGTMMMMMPGLGESNMPSRVRLTIALALTAVLLPLHQQAYTVTLNTLGPVLLMLVQEIIIGAVLGLTARLALSALQVAGSVIAQQMGLGFVTAVDPTQNQQGLLVGNFLTVLGVAMIFATDMHHLVIKALNDNRGDLVGSLDLLPTFPFTTKYLRRAVRGDYLNVFVTFDLTLRRLGESIFTTSRWPTFSRRATATLRPRAISGSSLASGRLSASSPCARRSSCVAVVDGSADQSSRVSAHAAREPNARSSRRCTRRPRS